MTENHLDKLRSKERKFHHQVIANWRHGGRLTKEEADECWKDNSKSEQKRRWETMDEHAKKKWLLSREKGKSGMQEGIVGGLATSLDMLTMEDIPGDVELLPIHPELYESSDEDEDGDEDDEWAVDTDWYEHDGPSDDGEDIEIEGHEVED